MTRDTLSLTVKIQDHDPIHVEIRFCRWCQRPFLPKRKDHNFCSFNCKNTKSNKTG